MAAGRHLTTLLQITSTNWLSSARRGARARRLLGVVVRAMLGL